MKRPKSHVIDAKARAILEQSLTPWIVNAVTHDYGRDFNVEVVDDGEVSGEEIVVQLKGQERPKYVGEYVSFRLSTRHLQYYVDCVRNPVFLIVVDVWQGEGYWLFLQEHVNKQLNGKGWRRKNSATLKIPRENRLSSLSKLRDAVRSADQLMRSLRPGAALDALHAETQRYQSMDPRFSIHLKTDGDKFSYEARARSDVPITVTIIGRPSEIERKLDELIGRGREVAFDPGELCFAGSPLLENIGERVKSLRLHKQLDVAMRFTDVSSGRTLAEVPAKAECGTVGATVTAAWTTGNFSMQIAFAGDKAQVNHCEWNLDLRPWNQRHLLRLPYFGLTETLAETMAGNGEVRLDILREGNIACSGRIHSALAGPKNELEYIRLISKARQVAELRNIDPVVRPLDDEAVNDIRELHGVLVDGEYRTSAHGSIVSCDMAQTDYERLQTTDPLEPFSIKMQLVAKVFDALVVVDNLEARFSRMQRLDDQVEERTIDGVDYVRVKWKGKEDAEQVVRAAATPEC